MGGAERAPGHRSKDALTVVLPFYNEEDYIADTLQSLLAQRRRPDELALVDNGSTDASVDICRAFQGAHAQLPIRIVMEKRPGKVFALETGFEGVATEYVAFCDADTVYPPHYFELALRLLGTDGEAIGAMALGLTAPPDSVKGAFERWKGALVGAALARQCHTGGYGHVYRTEMLRRSGGYSPARWPYMQADHEVVHQALKVGRCRYHRDLWCRPSARRTERANVSWTLLEVLLYHATPFALKDWYFYSFLRARFERRRMLNVNLRERPWADAAPRPAQPDCAEREGERVRLQE